MRILSLFLILITANCFAQKSPVGLIIEFENNTTLLEQKAILKEANVFTALNEARKLKGFEVTLAQFNSSFTVASCEILINELYTNSAVKFASIFYKTAEGSYGGDLSNLYVQPKNETTFEQIQQYFEQFNIVSVKRHHHFNEVFELQFNKSSIDIRVAQEILNNSGNFKFASVNTLHSVLATVDDPYYEYQWAIENEATPIQYSGTAGADMSVASAWTTTTGSADIKIAVLDSGIDTNHVDLMVNLLPGFDATGDGSKGYPNTTYSNDGHGTCSAGIIGAVGDNGMGTAGVAYDCKLIPVKIFYYVEFGGDVIPFSSSEAGVDGVMWAVNTAKADVLSNSWGIRDSEIIILGIDTAMGNLAITNGVQNGRDGLGTPMLFSSGNEGDPFSIWPAAHPLTISVGASTMCDELKTPSDCSPEGWWGSNYGDNLDVVAPGVKVLSTDMSGSLGYNNFIDDDYSMFNGTSAACPNAAGVMALILSVNPSLGANDARAILAITADKTGGYIYGTANTYGDWSSEMGYGRVNASAAVNYAATSLGLSATTRYSDVIHYSNTGTNLILSAAASNVTIYNMQGAIVAQLIAPNQTIALSDLIVESGLYLIQVELNGRSETLKVVL